MALGAKGWLLRPAFLILMLLVFPSVAPVQAGRPDPMGFWMTEDGTAMVDIEPCGAMLCGNIAWSAKSVDAQGRPLCRRAILGDVEKTGPYVWGKGWIYVPKTDDKYPVTFTITPEGSLAIHIAVGLMGRDQTWKRPAEAPALCSQ
jgi:uncharacterized protein (DUF2147 family)